jgi:hypothetical protein
MEVEVEKIKAEVTALVKNELAAAQASAPADKPESPEAPPESAIEPATVRLEEEKQS